MPLDVLPGCPQLAVAADTAAGEDGSLAGVSEAELIGLVCGWHRVEAHAAGRKLAAIAELDRRNPNPEDAEFTADQLACALGESRARAGELIGTAGHLDTHLPGTAAALCDGTISLGKARIMPGWTAASTNCAPAPTSTCCWAKIPGPVRTAPQLRLPARPPTWGADSPATSR